MAAGRIAIMGSGAVGGFFGARLVSGAVRDILLLHASGKPPAHAH